MRWAALALVLAWSTHSRAEDELPAIPPGADVIVPLDKGKAAPFQGQLFDTNTALRWGLWLQQYKARIGLEREHSNRVCAVKLEYAQSALDIHTERSTVVEVDLKERLLRTETSLREVEFRLANPAWYESGTFHFALGVVTTGAIVWVGARVVN